MSWTRSVLGGFGVAGHANETLSLSQDVVMPLQLSNDGTTLYSLMTTLKTIDDETVEGDTFLQYSTNGGTTWTTTAADPANIWLDYAVGGPSGEVVVAILVNSDVNAPAYFSVSLSLDRGVTWADVDISSVLQDTTELTNAVVSATGRTIAISTDTGIIASKDRGATWQVVPVPEDAWTLAGVEDGTGGLINLFAWDTNGQLWTPYGPGTALENPAVVSSAYYAVDRKKPKVAAALAAALPQASSVVTSTKITIDMGINQANSLSPELVELQHAALARATNGSMFPSAFSASRDNSPQSYTTVLKQVTAATLSACKAYSSCNNVYSGTRNAIGTVTGPVCGEGVWGAVLNLAVGAFAGQSAALGTSLGSAAAMLPDFCPNAPTGLAAAIAIAGWVRVVVEASFCWWRTFWPCPPHQRFQRPFLFPLFNHQIIDSTAKVVSAAIDVLKTTFSSIGNAAFPLLTPRKMQPIVPSAPIPFGKPCVYNPGGENIGWIKKEYR